MGFILWILSLVLAIILLPIGFIFGIFFALYKQKFWEEGLPNLNKKFMRLATAVDIYGNVACKELFNLTLIKDDNIHPFGDYGETISQVMGWNKIKNNLTRTGKILDKIMDLFDKNHSLKSIK